MTLEPGDLLVTGTPEGVGPLAPGDRVRTRITCPEQGVDVEVVVRCRGRRTGRVVVSCRVPAADGAGSEELSFVLEDGLSPPSSPGA